MQQKILLSNDVLIVNYTGHSLLHLNETDHMKFIYSVHFLEQHGLILLNFSKCPLCILIYTQYSFE